MKQVAINSMTEIKFLSELTAAPKGGKAAYVETVMNEKKNRYEGRIHLIDLDTGKTRLLTNGGAEFGYLWDDDDTLLFGANRGEDDKGDGWKEKSCFYRLNVNGGEAVKAFEIEKNAVAIKKAGEGLYAVLARVDLNKPEEKDEDYADYHVITEVPLWGNGRGFVSGIRMSLFLYNEYDNTLKQITAEKFQTRGFDVKDGKILYTGLEYTDLISRFGEAHIYDIETGADTCIIERGNYSIHWAKWTASGILYSMTNCDTWGSGQLPDFYRSDADGTGLKLAWKTPGRLIGGDTLGDCSYGGGTDVKIEGDKCFFISMEHYIEEICCLDEKNDVTVLTAFGCRICGFDKVGDTFYYVGQKKDGLDEIYAFSGSGYQQLTSVNDAFLNEHYVAQAEYTPFTDSDGVQIDGWVLKPYDYDPEKTYPGVLEIHGGPRCAYSTPFFHEMQVFASAGYFVFFCNPRGGEGYGEEFADLRGKYGTVDYQDLMEFTDHVLAEYPQIDAKKLGAAGGSYGGFMCNWIEGHTDRFAAIASQRSISNWVADFGASEIGVTFDQNEMGANPWTDMEKMWEQSPLKFADKAKTPILFIHSMCDYNCPIDQGIEMFTAMKFFGVPARMCLFEGENHSLSRSGKPRHRERRLQEMLDWFRTYLG